MRGVAMRGRALPYRSTSPRPRPNGRGASHLVGEAFSFGLGARIVALTLAVTAAAIRAIMHFALQHVGGSRHYVDELTLRTAQHLSDAVEQRLAFGEAASG